MATNTYVALDKTVTTSSATTLTWSSIPSGYTDLFIVGYCKAVAPGGATFLRFNGDSATNYSRTRILGTGSSASSVSVPNETKIAIDAPNTEWSNFTVNVQNYSNNTTYKTALNRANSSDYVTAQVGTWRNTAAITSITLTIDGGSFVDGSTFSLYGIAAEGVSPAPLATGGAIYSDEDYYYHAFGATGTFTPLQSLTCDYVVVAGGGGSGYGTGGGGGAGGFRSFTSQSFTATGYAVTVGAGGAGSTSANSAGSDGSTSSFNSISTTGGGGGGSQPGNGAGSNGRAGGSGGGAARSGSSYSGGSGNAGSYTPVEGFAGGNNTTAASNGCGGGGGAGGAGASGTTTADGAGGIGATSALVTAIVNATGVGQLVSGVGYIAGGGGGGGGASGTRSGAAGGLGGGAQGGANLAVGNNGTANTGGGAGGAGFQTGGKGGSGVVIIRYAKA